MTTENNLVMRDKETRCIPEPQDLRWQLRQILCLNEIQLSVPVVENDRFGLGVGSFGCRIQLAA